LSDVQLAREFNSLHGVDLSSQDVNVNVKQFIPQQKFTEVWLQKRCCCYTQHIMMIDDKYGILNC